jgi:hypothetical protein
MSVFISRQYDASHSVIASVRLTVNYWFRYRCDGLDEVRKMLHDEKGCFSVGGVQCLHTGIKLQTALTLAAPIREKPWP